MYMSNNALVLLYRIYLDSKKKSEAEGYDTVEKYLLHHNFFQTDEKLSKDNWDEDLFLTHLEELSQHGYVDVHYENSFRIEDAGIEYIEDFCKQYGIL